MSYFLPVKNPDVSRAVLWHAWDAAALRTAGRRRDGESFERIESRGMEGWLDEGTQDEDLSAAGVRRVQIPKHDGGLTPKRGT
jgi:hypothetical protein